MPQRPMDTGNSAPPPASHPPDAESNYAAIGIVAGEASGDLLGNLLIRAVQDAGYRARFRGIAGPRMQAAGARSLFPMETLAVRGYVEALSNLPAIVRIRRKLAADLLADPPRLFIGVDAPDFNLALEARLRRRGIPTVHFVSPSIWAWRRGRIRAIRKAVSHMLCIFPFEEAMYREADIPATYVGHPLAHALPSQPDRNAACARLGLSPERRYVALLPGSRQSELAYLAELFIATAQRLATERPDLRFLVPLVSRETKQRFLEALHRLKATDLPLRILFGHAHEALQAADVALIASGTATLEALLLDCPHVITYRVPWLTYQIMRRQAYLPWVGLPNILAQAKIVPERLQEQATPPILAHALLELLDDASRRAAMRAAFAGIRAHLRRDTPALIVAALRPYLQASPG